MATVQPKICGHNIARHLQCDQQWSVGPSWPKILVKTSFINYFHLVSFRSLRLVTSVYTLQEAAKILQSCEHWSWNRFRVKCVKKYKLLVSCGCQY